MEICEDDTTDEQSLPTKSKPKKKSLCRLLMQKKTKVGCLSTEPEDTSLQETDSSQQADANHESLFRVSPVKKSNFNEEAGDNNLKDQSGDKTRSNQSHMLELDSSDSPRDHCNSTKLSLCCAMTESSRSLNHQQSSNYHRHNSITENPKCILSRAVETDGHNKSHKMTDNRNRAAEEDNVESRAQEFEETSSVVERANMREGSIEVHRSSSQSPTPSEVSSCDSSPLPISSHSHLRKRLLSQRMSADNLLVAAFQSPVLRQSSPDSSKSVPETRRYKTRSASHDTMIPQKEHAERPSLSSRGSNPNLDGNKTVSAPHGIEASMDSLARNSLLAAQVLHLIPTTKARERNFLHGRIAANSLLGSLELERTLPQRELRIFVGTWNMNGQAPPHELNDFMLPEGLEHVPDVIAVGTQESFSERFEWEVSIQETVGPTHILFHSAVLGTLHLAIFIRRDLLWFCSVPEESSYSVRPGTAFRTKGAVAIAFMLFGTSYLFVTSHLTAHQEKVKERIHDIRRIVRSLDLPKVLPIRHKSKDVTQNFDCVFWCGDLNFRLSQTREEVIQWVSEQRFPLVKPHTLPSDQLRCSRAEGSVFREFDEGPITFPPTYKYDPGTQTFDTSQKQRAPAYTDRILFKCRGGRRESMSVGSSALRCLMYTSVPSISTSDHKPVWGLYKSIVRPGIDTIPLAAGLFNREVYLEGIKRRAAAMDKRQGASTVCNIQ